ncbi:MAG: beta-ketoacyl-ACP synthase [Neisseriaceae bacterium]|nr:beta-ketoacyl-ACP synthase [Neisseriaceae bacterium]
MNNPIIYLSSPALVSSLGCGLASHIDMLLNPPKSTTLTQMPMPVTGKPYYFGAVRETLPDLPPHLSQPYNRNNQLLWVAALQIRDYIDEVIEKYGKNRIAVVIGTSTGGIETNLPVFQTVANGGNWADTPIEQDMQVLSSPADFLRDALGLTGLTYGISTACTSGSRAIITAARLLKADLCDAVICGGTDMLSALTLNGFDSLSVLSNGIANPFSKNRNGINIGEAAALFVANKDGVGLPLLGYGVSSDAYHMSSPHPDGLGAEIAFAAALKNAQLSAEKIGWINLHGTGTVHNDAMESRAVSRVFGNATPATSTKPLTGHTLGAAGALEAAFLWGIVSQEYNPDGRLPPHIFDGELDPELPPISLTHAKSRFTQKRRIAASSSFAFGGNNTVLIIGENNA